MTTQIEVVQQDDGSFEACELGRCGSIPVGRGKTWEAALGAWLILYQSSMNCGIVIYDKKRKPWTRFSKQWRGR